MTNNKLCDIIGGAGALITAWCMGLFFFGVGPAVWGAVFGLVLLAFGLSNYD